MGRFAGVASYTFGQPLAARTGHVLLSFDALAKTNTAHCVVLSLTEGRFGEVSKEGWLPAGIAAVDGTTVVVGSFGHWLEIDGGVTRGKVDASAPDDQKVRERGPLRAVRTIAGSVYAVGGDRQAYRRSGRGVWTPFDGPMRPDARDATVYGLEAVDGFAEDDIYAVGWKGEIWHYDGVRWKRTPSSTDALLTSVCCGADGVVYVGGREGLLLAGRADSWERIDAGRSSDDCWSMVWFERGLYLSGTRGIHRLEGRTLTRVDTGLQPAPTLQTLSIRDRTLWSIGASDILTFDGARWERLD